MEGESSQIFPKEAASGLELQGRIGFDSAEKSEGISDGAQN